MIYLQRSIDKYTIPYYNVNIPNKRGGKKMSNNKKKSDNNLIKITLITSAIGLISQIIELLVKLLELVKGN